MSKGQPPRRQVGLQGAVLSAMLLLLTGVPVLAEVAGTPAAPAPGAIPGFQIRFGNDFFGIFDENPDDFRTAQTSFGVRIASDWLATLDISNFTDRGSNKIERDPGEEGRIDQATLSLGYLWDLSGGDNGTVRELVAGLSIRHAGRLNGADIQNGLHEVINDNLVFLPYEDVNQTDLGGFVSLNLHDRFSDKGKWGWWLPAQGLVTEAGQGEISLAGYLTRHFEKVTLWIGFREELRDSGDVSAVIDNAIEQEEGTYGVLGLQTGPLVLDLGHKFDSDYGYGWLSLMEDPRSAAARGDSGHLLTVSLGAELTHFGLRTDLGWIAPETSPGSSLRWGIVSVFKGGESPEEAPPGWDEFQREATIGPALYWRPRWQAAPWASFITNLRFGKREEGFQRPNGSEEDDRSVEQEVLAADFALLVDLDGRSLSGLGLKLGVTGWHPLDGEDSIQLGNRSATVMKDQLVSFVSLDYAFSL